MRVAAAFIGAVLAVEAFVPENAFRSAHRTSDLAPLKATHYESIAEIRQVKVSFSQPWHCGSDGLHSH